MTKDLMNGLYANMLGEKKKKDNKEKSEMPDMSKSEEKDLVKEDELQKTKDKIKSLVAKIQTEGSEYIEGLISSSKNTSKNVSKNKAVEKPVVKIEEKINIEEKEEKMASENILNIEVPSRPRSQTKKKPKSEKKKSKPSNKDSLNFEDLKKKFFGKVLALNIKNLSIVGKLKKIKDKFSFEKKPSKKEKTSERKQYFSSLKVKLDSLFVKKIKSKSAGEKKKKNVKKVSETNGSIISFDKVYKSFDGVEVLKNFSVKIKKGESFVLLGRSGVGKSVFIKIANGLLKPDKGTVSVFGNKIHGFFGISLYKLNKDISFLFQGGALFDSMTVLENVAFGIVEAQRIKKDVAFEIAREKLADVELDADDIGDKYPSELSGGMKKRVALARAIATNPKIIFFDEPTTGLDPVTAEIINDLILKVVKKIGATAITITHDIHSAVKIADKVALLNDGKLEWKGTVKELKKSNNENLKLFLKNL